MTSKSSLSPVVTGMGIVSAIGWNIDTFREALLAGRSQFTYLQRVGRQGTQPFIGAEIVEDALTDRLANYGRLLRGSSLSTQMALAVALEAWTTAKLSLPATHPDRIGLVIGGSNINQRYQQQTWQHYQTHPEFLLPTYGLSVWDSDAVGVVSQALQIQGEGYTVGGASASGAIALIQAARQVQWGLTDISLAIGSLADLSSWECQGLINLGAMGSERFASQPHLACRPFDQAADGFIYGESCGAVILENPIHAEQRNATIYGQLCGWGMVLDGNRHPNPNVIGEEKAMRAALTMAGLLPEQINYVNTHGTGSPLGDQTEVAALKSVGLSHCWLNATKSLTGHGLSAAGVVEVITTLLQLQANCCHPTANLINPIDQTLQWVQEKPISARMNYALSNSFGFGGINTSLVLAKEHSG
uniref:Beta-ketoacyl synthase n=1 Tax=Cyanothece sp. (strain PCC 7425 / ATCC 29141) TaxID=395961 RepID=B8HKZ6_CYAP4